MRKYFSWKYFLAKIFLWHFFGKTIFSKKWEHSALRRVLQEWNLWHPRVSTNSKSWIQVVSCILCVYAFLTGYRIKTGYFVWIKDHHINYFEPNYFDCSSICDFCCSCDRSYRCTEFNRERSRKPPHHFLECEGEDSEFVEVVGVGAPRKRGNMGDENHENVRSNSTMLYRGRKRASKGCPGSLEACIAACPSQVDVFEACTATCGRRCGKSKK